MHDQTTQTPCGTFQYAAPEVISEEEYSQKVDMWALGCVLFTLLVAYPPFYDDDRGPISQKIRDGRYEFASPWWDEISIDAKDLVTKLLEVDPRRRLSASQVMHHKWIHSASGTQSQGLLSPSLQSSEMTSLLCQATELQLSLQDATRHPHQWSPIPENLKTPMASTPLPGDLSTSSYFHPLSECTSGSCNLPESPAKLELLREFVNAPLKHYESSFMHSQMQPFELNLSKSNLLKRRSSSVVVKPRQV